MDEPQSGPCVISFFFIYNFLPRNIHTAARLKPYSRKVTILYFLLFKFQSIQSLHSQTANVLNSRNHLDFFSLFFSLRTLFQYIVYCAAPGPCIHNIVVAFYFSFSSIFVLTIHICCSQQQTNWIETLCLSSSPIHFLWSSVSADPVHTPHIFVCVFLSNGETLHWFYINQEMRSTSTKRLTRGREAKKGMKWSDDWW